MQNDGSISPVKAFFRNKWVKLILVINVLAIIAVIGVIVFNVTKTVVINFDVAPVDAKIQIDGFGNYSSGSYNIHPGNHEITISHDGLITKTFTMDLQSGHDATLIAFLSGENNNFEFYELRDNYDSFQQLAAIASEGKNTTTDQDTSAAEFITHFKHAYDLWQNNLPIEYSNYENTEDGYTKLTVGVTIKKNYDDCQKYLCIKAVIKGADKNYADQLLIDKGFDLEDYEVIYKLF